MKIIFLTLSVFLLASCDQPQRNRLSNTIIPGAANPVSTSQPWGNPFNNTTGGMTGATTAGATGGTTGSTRPPGFENCDLSQKYYASTINYMGICQSTLDETSVAISSSVSDAIRTCLIPTYKDNAGSSTYLGQPQCYAPVANQVMMGKLYRTRNGFSNLAINGVMVMKEGSLTAYFTCMDAYVSFPRSMCPNGPQTSQSCYQLYVTCPNGAQTSPNCDQIARSAMNTKCNDFKAIHSYIDIRLR
jgi:hypothetical protein